MALKAKKSPVRKPAGSGAGPAPRAVRYPTTTAPLPSPAFDALPEGVRNQYEALRTVAPKTPKMAISQIEPLVEQYPDVPQLLNLLTLAHSAARDHAATEACIRKAYERFPNNVFARLNFAELCLARGELGRIPEIFEGNYDLRALYPDRKVFHVGEVVPFCGLMAEYFHRLQEPEKAEAYFDCMKGVAPKDPMTRKVDRLLHPPLVRRLFGKG